MTNQNILGKRKLGETDSSSAIPTIRASKQRTEAPKKAFNVVVLGDTGSGKSSMLNCLLGECVILPTNCMRACTASCVELLSHDHLPSSSSTCAPYLARVEFLSLNEWERELDQAYEELIDKETGLILAEAPKNKESKASISWWKLKSIFGRVCSKSDLELVSIQPSTKVEVSNWLDEKLPDASWKSRALQAALDEDIDAQVLTTMNAEELGSVLSIEDQDTCTYLITLIASSIKESPVSPAESVRRLLLKSCVTLEASTAHDLHPLISPYVDSANEQSQGALWPLVRRVQIFGKPWSEFIGSTILIDAPGIQDDNSARDVVVHEKMKSADSVLIVSNIRRAVNDQSAKAWLPRPFRQKLVDDGSRGACAFIATASDWLEPSEIAANLNLPFGTPRLQCALKRNDYIKRRLTIDWYDGLDVSRNPAAKAQRDRAIEEQAMLRQSLGLDQPGSQSQEVTAPGPSSKSRKTPLSKTTPPSNPKVAKGIDKTMYKKKSVLWRKMNSLLCSLDSQVQSSTFIRTHPSVSFKTALESIEVAAGESFEYEHPGLHYEWEVKPVYDPASLFPSHSSSYSASEEGGEGGEDDSGVFTFQSFQVSAQDCQKLEGKRPETDGPPHTFFSIEHTQIPALRSLLKNLSQAHANRIKDRTTINAPAPAVPLVSQISGRGFISIDLDDEPAATVQPQPSSTLPPQPLPPFLSRVKDALEDLNKRLAAACKNIETSKCQTYSDTINLTAMKTFSLWILSYLERDVAEIKSKSVEVRQIEKTTVRASDPNDSIQGERPGEWLMEAMEAVKRARDEEDREMNAEE